MTAPVTLPEPLWAQHTIQLSTSLLNDYMTGGEELALSHSEEKHLPPSGAVLPPRPPWLSSVHLYLPLCRQGSALEATSQQTEGTPLTHQTLGFRPLPTPQPLPRAKCPQLPCSMRARGPPGLGPTWPPAGGLLRQLALRHPRGALTPSLPAAPPLTPGHEALFLTSWQGALQSPSSGSRVQTTSPEMHA